MVKQVAPGCAAVSSKELSTKCWHPCRFIQNDGQCHRVWTCSYPEKKHCQAVIAEIRAIMKQQGKLIITFRNLKARIQELAAMLE